MGLRKSLRKFDKKVRKTARSIERTVREDPLKAALVGTGLVGLGGVGGAAQGITGGATGLLPAAGALSGIDYAKKQGLIGAPKPVGGAGGGAEGFGGLPGSQQGLLNTTFDQANQLAGQATTIDPRLESTVGRLENFQNPGLDQMGRVVAGEYLNANPYLDKTYDRAASAVTRNYNDVVIPGITSRFGLSGRSGSPAESYGVSGAQENLGRSLGDLATGIYGGNYATERGYQQQAAGLLPAFNLDLLNAQYQQRAGLGNLPYQRLGQLAQIGGANSAYGSGAGGGGGQQNQGAGILGGALSGFQLGNALYPGVGGAVGAIGGGLLGGGFI